MYNLEPTEFTQDTRYYCALFLSFRLGEGLHTKLQYVYSRAECDPNGSCDNLGYRNYDSQAQKEQHRQWKELIFDP